MLRKDELKPFRQAQPGVSTADGAEVARFEKLADEWWRPDGAFKVVHAFNAARVAHLSRILTLQSGRSLTRDHPLAGLSLIDVGCGAGLVAEPMARLGATVTGIDAAARNVAVAARHASGAGIGIEYVQALPEAIAAEGRRFDIVLSLEVVEHVADVVGFLGACATLVKPGGLAVIGTLNRTAKSYALAIVGAEYVLGWLPRGTHDWSRFVTPAELQRHLTPHGCIAVATEGVVLNPLSGQWFISRDASVNYLSLFRKSA
jgi:2-polyprenyl-6-hydroxyphenyl methylase / 3-demethylubiquinone-9 3-methyltransferase